MPGKARRVASRQAQLNRRKRQQRGPTGIPAVETETPPKDQQPAENTNGQVANVAEPVQAVTPATTATGESHVTRPLGPGRLRREQVSSANYVGSELRRILIMGGVILAVIIVLGIIV